MAPDLLLFTSCPHSTLATCGEELPAAPTSQLRLTKKPCARSRTAPCDPSSPRELRVQVLVIPGETTSTGSQLSSYSVEWGRVEGWQMGELSTRHAS